MPEPVLRRLKLAGVIALLVAAVAAVAWRVWARPEERPVATAFATAEVPPAPAQEGAVADVTVVPTMQSASASDAPAPAAPIDVTALIAHLQGEGGRCLAGTAAAAKGSRIAVHRWVDAKGITHFSDTPPGGEVSGHRVIEVEGVPPIVVRARGHDVNLPVGLQQRAIADALAIERALRDELGVEGESGLVLDVVFVQSPQAYARFVPAPALATSAGAYSGRDRTIHVRWQADEEVAFLVLRHEITHALVHERIGRLPIALNEGLAGFFERLGVSGLGAQVAPAAGSRGWPPLRISEDGIDELVDLLAREHDTFLAEGREQRYLQAFGLVATLMERREGRLALGAVLAAQRADSCQPVDAGRLLDGHYPGGLIALAGDWSRWLRDPPSTVHAF